LTSVVVPCIVINDDRHPFGVSLSVGFSLLFLGVYGWFFCCLEPSPTFFPLLLTAATPFGQIFLSISSMIQFLSPFRLWMIFFAWAFSVFFDLRFLFACFSN